jgi:5-enolpyruvylshikimate-3-phosphate synthase
LTYLGSPLPFRALGAVLARREDDELAVEGQGFELEVEAQAVRVREGGTDLRPAAGGLAALCLGTLRR